MAPEVLVALVAAMAEQAAVAVEEAAGKAEGKEAEVAVRPVGSLLMLHQNCYTAVFQAAQSWTPYYQQDSWLNS